MKFVRAAFGHEVNHAAGRAAELGIVFLYYGTPINELRPGINPTEGQIGSGELYRISTNGKASSDSQSLYVQDRWQPINRLSLNLGIRAERETVPSFTAGAPGIKFNFGDKIAPRLGLAYDLTGETAFRIRREIRSSRLWSRG